MFNSTSKKSFQRCAAQMLICAPMFLVGNAWAISATTHRASIDCEGSPYNCKLPNPDPPNGKRCGGVNRLKNPLTGDCSFTLTGPTPLLDGLGGVVGVAVSQKVSINYGQRKTLRFDGMTADYGFALGVRLREVDAMGRAFVVSGWVPLSAVNPQNDMPKAMPRVDAPEPPLTSYARYRITGGGNEIFDEYAHFKVTPNAPLSSNSHQNVGDYLARPTPVGQDVVNFLYSLPGSGGVATDCLPVGSEFEAANAVPAQSVPMFDGHVKVAQRMAFLYGRAGDGSGVGGYRYGWIARWAVTPLKLSN